MTDRHAKLRDDPMALVTQIHQRAIEGQAIARARPSIVDVGAAFSDLHAEFCEAVWGSTVGAPAAGRAPLQPRLGTPGEKHAVDCGRTNPANGLVLEVAGGYVTAIRDHVAGFAQLASVGGPARSMLALARVLLDASVHASFVLAEDIDERARCGRALNLRFAALRLEIADARGDSRHLETEREVLMRAAVEDGFERLKVQDKQTGKQKTEWFVRPHQREADLIANAVGGAARSSWRVLSSVVHAQERAVVRFPLGLEAIDPGPHAPMMIMAHAATPLVLTIEAMRAIERYYGTTGTSVDDEAVAHAIATLRASTGGADEAIRRRLGFFRPESADE